jgi:alpha-amylase
MLFRRLLLVVLSCFAASALTPQPVRGQSGFDDDRVMLQGFYWESYRHGHPEKFPSFGNRGWYRIVQEQAGAIHATRFDLYGCRHRLLPAATAQVTIPANTLT